MAKFNYDRLEAEERVAQYDTMINALREQRIIISETNPILSLRREASDRTLADYKAMKAEAALNPKADFSAQLKKIPIIQIGASVFHPAEAYAVLEQAILKRDREIMKQMATEPYSGALKEEGDYLFELGYFVRSAREYDDLQQRISLLYTEREQLLVHLNGGNKQDRNRAKDVETLTVKNMVKKLQKELPDKTVDELLWHIADKVNKDYETVKSAYHFKKKRAGK